MSSHRILRFNKVSNAKFYLFQLMVYVRFSPVFASKWLITSFSIQPFLMKIFFKQHCLIVSEVEDAHICLAVSLNPLQRPLESRSWFIYVKRSFLNVLNQTLQGNFKNFQYNGQFDPSGSFHLWNKELKDSGTTQDIMERNY